MNNRIDKEELARRVAKRLKVGEKRGNQVVDAVIEEIYDAMKNGDRVSLLHFGTFHVDKRRKYTIFQFRPSQRLRALFGWSSTYKGEL